MKTPVIARGDSFITVWEQKQGQYTRQLGISDNG